MKSARKKQKETDRVEGALHIVHMVKDLVWEPKLTSFRSLLQKKDGSMKGKYMVRCTNWNDQTDAASGTAFLAEISFDMATLVYAQQLLHDAMKPVKCKGTDEKLNDSNCFVSVKQENVIVEINSTHWTIFNVNQSHEFLLDHYMVSIKN